MSLPTAWDVRAAAGEPHAVIRVRNLQTTLGPGAATDAWGRTGRAQPAVLSAEVVLDAPFAEAAVTDRVAADTVHYGTLSKALLENIAHWGGPSSNGKAGADDGPSVSLMTVLYGIWVNLTGQTITGWTSKPMKLDAPVPINSSVVRSFSVSVLLPKASLAGEGVSMTLTGILAPQAAAKDAEVRIDHARPAPIVSHTLRLHRIRVPTLVGVHPHERTAKQVVIADVALDQYNGYVDVYTQLEAFVVRVCLSSSIVHCPFSFLVLYSLIVPFASSWLTYRSWKSRRSRRSKRWPRTWPGRSYASSGRLGRRPNCPAGTCT